MNLPNKLTVGRIVLVPFFVAALLIDFPCNYIVALLLFIVASITDMLDGKIARKRNLVTDFGKFADPLADKILVLSAFLCFVQLGLCDCVSVILVLFREFSVTSVRLIAASKGEVVAANIWGKIKTVTQMIAIILILVLQAVLQLCGMGIFGAVDIQMLLGIFTAIGIGAIWISNIFTVLSGAVYFVQNKKFISDM